MTHEISIAINAFLLMYRIVSRRKGWPCLDTFIDSLSSFDSKNRPDSN